MKVPAVTYRGHIYTAPTGHVDALARLVVEHGPSDYPERWARDQLDLGTIRYGWLVNKQFKERAT